MSNPFDILRNEPKLQPGEFFCGPPTPNHRSGLLKVKLQSIALNNAEVSIGATDAPFSVQADTAAVLGEFFTELGKQLKSK